MNTRSEKTQRGYDEFKKNRKGDESCRFCDETLPEEKNSFAYWKILHARFPYDNFASLHDMIVPKRHFKYEIEMVEDERKELVEIKTAILPARNDYDSMLENMKKNRTMDHYHIHLLRFRPFEK